MLRYSLLMGLISNPMVRFMMYLIYLRVDLGLGWILIELMERIVRVSLGRRYNVVVWGLHLDKYSQNVHNKHLK